MELTQRELLARTLQMEAGNQGVGGMLAAGAVIMNRLGAGTDLSSVILKPGQFSAWNSVTGYAGGEQGQNTNFKPNELSYMIADNLLSGSYDDPTGGATHYYNPEISNPSWGLDKSDGQWETTAQIGDHLFGRADNNSGLKRTSANITPNVDPNKTVAGREATSMTPVGPIQNAALPPNAQQPNAQQMQQMQQGQNQGGLMGFLRNPRTRELLASLDVSGRFDGVRQRASADVAKADEREKNNRTAQWLSTQPNGQKYAQAITTGALTGSEAYSQYISDTQRKGVTIGKKLIDPITGETIYEDTDTSKLDKDQNAIISGLNDDLRSIYKPYNEISNGYNQIANAMKNTQSGVGDLVLTIAFAKILDPGSVVRSEESAAVAAAGGGIGAAIKAFNNFLDGSGLLPEFVRTEIQNTAAATAKQWYDKSKAAYDRSVRQAELSGIPMDIIREVIAAPSVISLPPLPEPGPPPLPKTDTRTQSAKDAGISLDDWNDMNEAERAPFG